MITDRALKALELCPPHPFPRAQSQDHGLTTAAVDELVRTGLLAQPLRGIVHRADLPDAVELRAAAARLALPPGAALCRTTAAWLWKVDCRVPGEHLLIPDVQCVVPTPREVVRRPGLRCYQADLPAQDVTAVAGLPVTTPARTAIDLARHSTPGMGLGALDAMCRAGLIDPAELLVMVERWRGRRFIAQARRLVSYCDPLAESFGESWMRLRLLDAGFPRPQLQVPLADRNGIEIYRIDLAYEEVRHGYEYDGEQFHLGADLEHADRLRRERMAVCWGWTVVGVGKALVLGPSMALELAVGEALSLEPTIRRRRW